MANVYLNDISVPRIARNKRIYSGSNSSYVNTTSGSGGGESVPINPLIIAIVNEDTPIIQDYSIYADTYGQYPKIRLFEIDGSNNRIERTELPYFTIVDELISSVTFGTIDSPITGFILISK